MTEREQFEAVLPTLIAGQDVTEWQKELMWMAWQERATAARQGVNNGDDYPAVQWIRRHKCEYTVEARSVGLDVSVLHFIWGEFGGYAILETAPDNSGECQSVMVNLETAADCESLCKVLRVKPEVVR